MAIRDYALASERLVEWMQDRAREAGARGGVFGVSGGIDSALVLALSRKAYGDNCLALIMPCYSLQEDVDDALELVRLFGCPYKVVDLCPAFDALLSSLSSGGGEGIPGGAGKEPDAGMAPDASAISLAEANIKPRLRMTALYYYANLLNYLVVGTSNRAELYVGYSTKYGDSGVDIMPLGGLTKGEVREMAAYLGVPKKIIEKAPSAGLWKGQTDEGEMGITYRDLDRYLLGLPVPDDVREKIERRHRNSEHKRRMPPVPDVI
ncbi:MAG TPA: NAD(+) synthase [Firmicutes bacterium]|nr:NAD(+) synthase [Candidatus Fermentithermobacillaceae bacterium]